MKNSKFQVPKNLIDLQNKFKNKIFVNNNKILNKNKNKISKINLIRKIKIKWNKINKIVNKNRKF